MKHQNQKLYIGLGIGGLLAFGLGIYFSRRGGSQENIQEVQNLDKVTVLQVLKELRKELFSVFTNFSMGRVRPEEIKMMLLEQPMFKDEINTVEQQVYNKFGITKENFQSICESSYAEDQDIQAIQKDMKQSFDKSFQGIAPDPKSDIPEFLTPAVMTEGAVKLNEKLLELMESGEQIDFNNPKLMQVMSDLKMDSQKKDILIEYGLDKYEQSAQQILQYATQVYQSSNKDRFNDQLRSIEQNYQGLMEQLLTQGPIVEAQVRNLMARNTQPPSNPFGGMGQFGGGSRSQEIFAEESKTNTSPKKEQQQKVQENIVQKDNEPQLKLDKSTVIQILKELKNALFPVYQNLSMLSNQIKNQYQGKIRPEEIKMMILEQPMFQNEIDLAEQTVFNKFKLTKKAFLQICQSDFRNDEEIQTTQQEMKQAFENSLVGFAEQTKCTIPEFLTAAKTLEILTRVMTEGVVLLNDKLLELIESGQQIDFNDPKLMSILYQLKSDSQKQDLLAEYGLDKYEQPAQQIFQYATQFYSENNQDGFLEQLRIVQSNYQGLIQQLLTSGPLIGNQVKTIMARNTKSLPQRQQQQEKKEVVVQEVEQSSPNKEIVQKQKDDIVVVEKVSDEKKEIVEKDIESNPEQIHAQEEKIVVVNNEQQDKPKQELIQPNLEVDGHNHKEENFQ